MGNTNLTGRGTARLLVSHRTGATIDPIRCVACDKPLNSGTRCPSPCCSCKTCGVEQSCLEDLNDDWQCSRCFVAAMAVTRCSMCSKPAHASETNDDDVCVSCQPRWLRSLYASGAL